MMQNTRFKVPDDLRMMMTILRVSPPEWPPAMLTIHALRHASRKAAADYYLSFSTAITFSASSLYIYMLTLMTKETGNTIIDAISRAAGIRHYRHAMLIRDWDILLHINIKR